MTQGLDIWLLLALVVGCGETSQSIDSSSHGGAHSDTDAASSSHGGAHSDTDAASSSHGGARSDTDSTSTSRGSAVGSGGTVATSLSSSVAAHAGRSGQAAAPNVLVFSRTLGYRHASIEAGIVALEGLARDHQFSLTTTEDPSTFSTSGLAQYDVVLFLSTTGDVLDAAQQLALEAFIRNGHGYVGVHAASDTEYDWPWYGSLVGAYFRDHPDVQSATLLVENANHPATQHLPAQWTRTDEWYAFRDNPRAQVEVLLCVDESTYSHDLGSMGADHPIAWYHEHDGGRAFYTGLGHTSESYEEPAFLEHLWGAIRWAAGQ